MRLKIYPPLAIHELGTRENQEDFIYPELNKATAADSLFIVCDGMGGHENGEVASMTFANALADYFNAHINSDEPLPDDRLNSAIAYAYGKLDEKDNGSYKKMGTTLTLLFLHRGGITAAHIGDSRIYHLRPGKKILYISRDHSLVFDLYQSGEISYSEMKTSQQKNVITRAVLPGDDNRVKPDIIHITDIKPGDYFFLCSDGMLEQMEDDELFRLLSSGGSDEKKLRQLLAATSDNNDNHSAYMIHVESVTHEDSDDRNSVNEELTAKCNALNIKSIKGNLDDDSDDSDATQIARGPEKVSHSRRPRKKKTLAWLWWAMLIAAIVAVAMWLALYGWQGNHIKKSAPDTTTEAVQPSSISNQPMIKRKPADTVSRESAARAATSKKSASRESVKSDNSTAEPVTASKKAPEVEPEVTEANN